MDFLLVRDEAFHQVSVYKADEPDPVNHLRPYRLGPMIALWLSSAHGKLLWGPYPVSTIAVRVIPSTILPSVVRDE